MKYLAFYQPKDKSNTTNKFDNNYGIEYYARIKDFYEYKRINCDELKCKNGKENDIYIRIELEEFEKVGPIERIEYGTRTVNYTTLYLLKNSNSMHELYFNNRKEIEVYKILRKISKSKNKNIIKEKNGFYLGSDFIKVLDNGDIKLNENKVNITELIHLLK